MNLSAVDPQLRQGYRIMRQAPVGNPLLLKLANRLMGLLPDAKAPEGMTLEKIPWGDAAGLRVYTPEGGGSGAALLWIHGGGLVLGSAVQDDHRCFATAQELDVVVVSAEYRLAPQHPFPLPLDDCLDAWSWLQQNAAARGIDPQRVAVGGQSAGGGLAAALVQRIHDLGGTQPVAQWLFCPMLDDRTAANRELDAVRHILWSNRSNRIGWSAYLGTAGASEVPDHAVPARREDLTGLPPAWIGTGDIDLFHDENQAYAERLTAAGVPTTFDVVPDAPHAFETAGARAEVSVAYLDRAHRWLRDRLG
ncbi:alpha/beta hydrolase [Promicromonospora sp. NPDC060271]|uniref:alpha/beta hydrolase n=1 Tax=Promicromonospora sp. NPDC060271 TaxID=3347089 RepID=UPI003662D60E